MAAALNADVDQAVKDFAPGLIAVRAPRKMHQARPQEIVVRIATRDVAGDLAQGLRQRGVNTTVEPILVGMTMAAHLHGNDFNIVNIDSEVQLVREGHDTEWMWDVEAKHHGVHHLKLTMSVILEAGNYTAIPSDVVVKDESIKVVVDPWYATRQLAAANWQKLLPSGGVLAAGAAGLGWRRKRRAARSDGSGADPRAYL